MKSNGRFMGRKSVIGDRQGTVLARAALLKFLLLFGVVFIVSAAPPQIDNVSEKIRGVQASVVDIQVDSVYYPRGRSSPGFLVQFLRDFLELDEWAEEGVKFQGRGSGVILDSSGMILTNEHVIEKAKTITVVLNSKKSFPAVPVGKNRKEDLALIKIESDGPLEPIVLGDSDLVQPADEAYAIGTPFGYSQSITKGIVSAVHRQIKNQAGEVLFEDLIQTDAGINPGNSGGPLLNVKGEMIGVVNMTDPRARKINFAIPINRVKTFLNELKTHEERTRTLARVSHRFGLLLTEEEDEKGGKQILVSEVSHASGASKAGLRAGDRLIRFRGKDLADLEDLLEESLGIRPGEQVYLEISRDNRHFFTYLRAEA